MEKLGWSFGSQSRAAVRIGANPDIKGIVKAAVKAGVGEAIVFGKCHTGFCFHPTKIGTPHPKLKIDMLGEMSRALRKCGIKVSAYLNFGMDGEAGRHHPDWLQYVGPDKVHVTKDHIANICPFTPYVDRLLLPLVQEMLELYQLDGFFFDTMTAFNVCYCKVCRKQYKNVTGLEIPVEKTDPGWAKYGKFQSDRTYNLLDRIGNFIHGLSPRAGVVFNHVGGIVFPGKVPESVNRRLSADPNAKEPWISMFANLLASGDQPGDVFIERFYRGWGDRSGLTDLTLEQKAAAIFAYRRRFFVGDRLHPEVRLAAGSNHAMQFLGTLWKKMNRYMPSDNIVRAPDAVVLHNEGLIFGTNMEFFGRPSLMRFLPTVGVYQIMVDSGWNFVLTPESNLEKWLSPERLLILPEILSISEAVDTLIRKFLAAGGRVLAVGTIPRLPDGSIPGWLGIKSMEDKPWQEYVYLPAWKPLADQELTLVHGNVHRINIDTAKSLLYPFACYDLYYGTRMGAGANSPASQPDTHPLLTCNAVGRGKAYYLNTPLFTDYVEGLHDQKLWFEQLLNRISKKPCSCLDSKSSNVELVPYGSAPDGVSWYVLLNHGGAQLSLAGHFIKTVGPLPAYRVVLQIRPQNGQTLKTLKINGCAVPVKNKKVTIQVPIVMDAAWKIVRAEWR